MACYHRISKAQNYLGILLGNSLAYARKGCLKWPWLPHVSFYLSLFISQTTNVCSLYLFNIDISYFTRWHTPEGVVCVVSGNTGKNVETIQLIGK